MPIPQSDLDAIAAFSPAIASALASLQAETSQVLTMAANAENAADNVAANLAGHIQNASHTTVDLMPLTARVVQLEADVAADLAADRLVSKRAALAILVAQTSDEAKLDQATADLS